jgi:hypothetical protein
MESIVQVLMRRDNMSKEEAKDLVRQCKLDLQERLSNGEMPEDICQEWFGLEPDYIFELL